MAGLDSGKDAETNSGWKAELVSFARRQSSTNNEESNESRRRHDGVSVTFRKNHTLRLT
jgi:hypothetical protein